jgi:hypothetical protein
MALSVRVEAFLKRLAAKGDVYAVGIMEAIRGEQGAGGARIEKILTDPVTAGTNNAVTAKAANLADNVLAIADTTPDFPRNVLATFGGTWDGGDITIVGIDHTGKQVTEVLADNAGGTTTGSVAWKSLISVTKQAVGAAAGTVAIGYSTKLGLGVQPLVAGSALCFVDGVGVLPTVDTVYGTIVPATAPDGTHDYVISAVKA